MAVKKAPAWHDGVNLKQRRFLEEYVANGFNATRAYIAAGYSERTAGVAAHLCLKKLNVRQALQRLLDEVQMTTSELKERIADDTKASLEPFLAAGPEGDLAWNFARAQEIGAFRHIKKVKIKPTANGPEVSIELVDRQRAQALLAQVLGMTRAEDDAPPPPPAPQALDLSNLSDEELKAFYALMTKASK